MYRHLLRSSTSVALGPPGPQPLTRHPRRQNAPAAAAESKPHSDQRVDFPCTPVSGVSQNRQGYCYLRRVFGCALGRGDATGVVESGEVRSGTVDI